ncbi:MAG TPA: zf-HC2 domain-containing protein [bacterium]|nr:zf-HC2 domain-containing protein [bacterium]
MSTSWDHPALEELAALADGAVQGAEAERLELHLSRCPRCLEAWAEAASVRAESVASPEAYAPDPEAVKKGITLVAGPPAHAPAPRPRAVRRVAGRAAFALGVLVVLVVGGKWSWEQVQWRRTIGPVREAMAIASAPGSLWYPEAGGRASSPAATVRSGGGELPVRLESSVDALFAAYREDAGSPELAYWLAAGLTVSGETNTARTILDAARLTSPGDVRLGVLDAILAYRESRLARAEEILSALAAEHPDQASVVHNLRRVREELREER